MTTIRTTSGESTSSGSGPGFALTAEDQAKQIADLSHRVRLLGDSSEALKVVYAEQMEWARHFNGLIWTIGSILLPIAFAGLALGFRNEHEQVDKPTLCFVGVASIGILFFWLQLGNWHRMLWRRSFVFTGIIEAAWQLRGDETPHFKYVDHVLHKLTPSDKGFLLRRLVVGCGAALWLVRIVYGLVFQ